MAETLGEQLDALGWQCGSVISESLYAEIETVTAAPHRVALRPQEREWLIVLSQSCDVVARTVDQEPHVELLLCHPIAQPRAQFLDLRSTRQLDFRPNRGDHPDLILTAHAAHDRYIIPRSLLTRASPRADRRLSPESVRRLQAWIALRYSRAAWPNQFVSRIASAQKTILEALEGVGRHDVAEIRVALAPNDRELPSSESYRLAVFFVVDEEIWNSVPTERERVQAAFSAFVAALGNCAGIELDDASSVVSGAEFSWQQMQMTDAWNFANLTWRAAG
jgi:hypothetical protein